MPKPKVSPDQNLLLFPAPGVPVADTENSSAVWVPGGAMLPREQEHGTEARVEVVLSGSYRKDVGTLRRTYDLLRDLGFSILSPTSISIVKEEDGFVYMQGEETETPERIEDRHLNAIQKANLVWLHAPSGYVGPTAALEVGFAHAAGVPVYSSDRPSDAVLRSFVQVVDSPEVLFERRAQHPEPPAPALKAFQEYYRRVALQRGYAKERPKDCLLLMVEEVGELARALRKRERLVRHASYANSNEAHELADVFLYVVHMANVLGVDLSEVVREKEIINVERFLAK